ncbi:MAG: plasmid recombination protein [Oscillospiraceae bacterium]|nr:plasmid recombination protein [Oscillospiraceae bacterium]
MIYDKAVAYAEQMSHTETYVIKKGKNASKTMTRTKTGMKKDTVTCLGLETAAPAGLSVSQYEKWAKRVHEIACEFFGADNVIDTDGHFDEIHLYRDPVKKEYVWSRFHIHTSILPRRADGSFCSRSIAKLCFSMIMTEHLPLGLEHAQKKLSEITVSDIVRKYKQPVVIADRIREEIVMLAPKLHDILKGK